VLSFACSAASLSHFVNHYLPGHHSLRRDALAAYLFDQGGLSTCSAGHRKLSNASSPCSVVTGGLIIPAIPSSSQAYKYENSLLYFLGEKPSKTPPTNVHFVFKRPIKSFPKPYPLVTASPLRRNGTSACPQAPRFEVLSEHQPESQWQFRYVVRPSAQTATQCIFVC
jgi:hypothetical protein